MLNRPKVTSKIVFERIKIYIDEVLHISIPIDKSIKIQSWRENEANYKIEIYCAGHLDIYVYDDLEKWKNVLFELDKHI